MTGRIPLTATSANKITIHAWICFFEPIVFHRMNPHICRTLSTICFQSGILSIALSIGIWWFLNGEDAEQKAHAERFGIFVGLWAPTLLILSNRFDRYADKVQPLPGLKIKDDGEDQS